MHRLKPSVAAILVGVLALLLIIYEFAGGRGWRVNPDGRSVTHSGAGQNGPETRCASQETYNLVKSELFRQAADLRGDDAGPLKNVMSSSSLRMDSPELTRSDDVAGIIGCAGTLTLDLPPGVTAADGRRSLAGEIGYAIRSSDEGGHFVTLSANAIIRPLATLSRAKREVDQQLATAESPIRARTRTAPAVETRPQREPGAIDSPPPSAAPAPAPELEASASPPALRPPAAQPPPAADRPRLPSATVRTAPIAAAPVSIISPSFDCRNARTRGEIAVCRNGNLANLDLQMAAQFNRAMSAADVGKRTQLERSRRRFLRFRDSCNSETCVASAYFDRMRQIDDIMNERWSPR